MKIIISGASGFIGASLVNFLRKLGMEVFRLVRHGEITSRFDSYWDPELGILNPEQLEGMDALINLSGESIRALRWTKAKKQRLYHSRIATTKLLCHTATLCRNPPKKILNASAIGYYGDHGSEAVDESTPAGKGFLAELCVQWEAATEAARAAHIPVILLRTGIVLDPHGGALKSMLPIFKLGLGGTLGTGSQYMSWIALDDFLHLILFLLEQSNVEGPVNFTAPTPVTNAVFTKTLGEVLHRPTFCTVPEFGIRALFGEMGQSLLLSSTRAYPQKGVDAGYRFLYPNLLQALQAMLITSRGII